MFCLTVILTPKAEGSSEVLLKVLNFASLVNGAHFAAFVKCATLATIGAFGVSTAVAADWYAKDNLQPGHDPSMIRFEDGYALMSTNNNLQL